jgi:hypothetical protein
MYYIIGIYQNLLSPYDKNFTQDSTCTCQYVTVLISSQKPFHQFAPLKIQSSLARKISNIKQLAHYWTFENCQGCT